MSLNRQSAWWPGKLILFFLLILTSSPEASAQADPLIGTCERSLGEGELNVGNVRARILNNGALFYRGEPHVYEVPKGSGKHSVYNTSFWIAGLMGDEIRASATEYGEWEFWAGPLDEQGRPPADCLMYDRVWEIHRDDIQTFLNTGVASTAITSWPWRLGAPVMDGDGDPDNYNLDGGDLPELHGDQTSWWVMNDRGNEHRSTGSTPIGLEVHGTAFAIEHPGFIGNQTFYNIKLINKNELPFVDAYFGLFMDADIGSFNDDYRGSDSLLHLAYMYNADDLDESVGESFGGYGAAPPAVGFTFLQGAVANNDAYDNDRDGEIDEPGERIGMNSAHYWFDGGGVHGSPERARDHYNYMQARWKDGTRLTVGGVGHPYSGSEAGVTTNFYMPGDPVTGEYWSALNYDNQGNAVFPGDLQMTAASGPFTLQPGESLDILFAVVWSRGNSNLDSVTRLKQEVASIRSVYEQIYEPTILSPEPGARSAVREVLGFDQNFPNPFTGSTTLRYSLPKPMQVRLAVYDILGREVALLVDQSRDAGIYTVDFDAGSLPAGIYFARIELDHLQFTKRMVLLTP